MTRFVYHGLGMVLLGLGLAGVVVPLLPTTIFLILAAACFARSSPRLETWLIEHPRLGPPLVAWRRHGAVSRGGKVSACIGMTMGFVLFWLSAHPAPWLAAGVAALLLASAAYVVSRPDPPQ